MLIVDSTALNEPPGEDSTKFDCDVCIIGTGPAGSTIARELSGSRLVVTVLESGGFERQSSVDELNEIESVGWPRTLDQWMVRNRMVGGSSNTWTGRCAAFDEIDFRRRDWVPYSGWPFNLQTITPYLERSAKYLGLGIGTDFSDDRFWSLAGHKQPRQSPDPALLRPFFWQYSRDDDNPYDYMRFGRHLASNTSDNVTLITNATVLSIVTNPTGNKVQRVEFADAAGRTRGIVSRIVVICAGAIENARLLLNSNAVVSPGLGNVNDNVGRFLMDHPRGTLARFRIEQADALLDRFGHFKSKTKKANLFQHGVRLSPILEEKEQLLNCSAWIHESITAEDPWHSLKRILRGKADLKKDLMQIVGNTGLFVKGLNNYFIKRTGLPRKLDGVSLDGMCEQRPDPDSRMTLSDRRDRFGVRLSRIDWRIHQDDARAMRRMGELCVEQFPKMGLEAPVLEEWVRDQAMFPAHFQDIAHPTGTTRMSENAKQGVVDAAAEVHGVSGLYISGSSVFPTAGHCNPTQMIVAMSIRLADTIKQRTSLASGNA